MFYERNLVLIVLVLLSKLILITAFTFWLSAVKTKERLPMMVDQDMYLADMRMISKDLTSVLLPDSEYESNNTFYSKICGSLAWFLQCFALPPIYAALIVNSISQVTIALFSTLLYSYANGRYEKTFFLIIAYSPAISAYSFFALRDLFILAFFSIFTYYTFTSRYFAALLVSIVFVVLRKFFLVFNILIIVCKLTVGYFLRSKRKVFSAFFYSMILFAAITIALVSLNFGSVMTLFAKQDPVYIVMASIGLGKFYQDEDSAQKTVASAETGKAARIAMFDSITLPFFFLLAVMFLLRRGTFFEKQLALTTAAVTLGLSIGYIAIQGNFPMRKLLPAMPLMYVVAFLAYERYRFGEQKVIAQRRFSKTMDQKLHIFGT